MRVSRQSNPFLEEGTRIENPELGRTGTIDLIFVLTVFVPLLIGVLGLGCGAYERETGLDSLIAIQRGRVAPWFLARGVAILSLGAGVVVLSLAVVALSVGSFGADVRGLFTVSVLYTALWSGLFTSTAVAARSRREAVLAYGGVWVLLVLLVPTLMSEQSLGSTRASEGMTVGLEQRAKRYSDNDADLGSLLAALYAQHPDLSVESNASPDALPKGLARAARDWSRVQNLVREHDASARKGQDAIDAAERTMAWSPAVVMTLATERLAGRDLAAAIGFRRRVVDAIAARADWFVTRSWGQKKLHLSDFNDLVGSRTEAVKLPTGSIRNHLWVLSGWALLSWLVGLLRLRRCET